MSDPENVRRGPSGEMLPGSVLNPTGENGRRPTGQPWKIRAHILEEKYPTLEDLLTFFCITSDQNAKIKTYEPNDKLKKMNHRDASIIVGLLEEFVGSDRIKARADYWDRHDGKPTQRNELTGAEGGPILVSSDEAADAVRRKLLPELAAGDKASET